MSHSPAPNSLPAALYASAGGFFLLSLTLFILAVTLISHDGQATRYLLALTGISAALSMVIAVSTQTRAYAEVGRMIGRLLLVVIGVSSALSLLASYQLLAASGSVPAPALKALLTGAMCLDVLSLTCAIALAAHTPTPKESDTCHRSAMPN